MEALDIIVRKTLRMDVNDRSEKSRMESLFARYVTLLRRNGLKWLLESNQKGAVSHVLSAVNPKSLSDCLTSDLAFANHELKEDFKNFMVHAIRLSEAFELAGSGLYADEKSNSNKPNVHHGNSSGSGGRN